jgi:hypothetical protein
MSKSPEKKRAKLRAAKPVAKKPDAPKTRAARKPRPRYVSVEDLNGTILEPVFIGFVLAPDRSLEGKCLILQPGVTASFMRHPDRPDYTVVYFTEAAK